jgi:hypothetical protein
MLVLLHLKLNMMTESHNEGYTYEIATHIKYTVTTEKRKDIQPYFLSRLQRDQTR